MSYEKRFDGRKFTDLRPIEAKVSVIKNADGSAYFKIGETVAYATVYGPRTLHPRKLQEPKTGILRVNYQMMPFSGVGTRIRPGQNRRAKEISMVSENALNEVVCLENFPKSVVDLHIDIPQADAGTRCAGLCAASMALADAGIPMRELIGAVAVGKVSDKLAVDLDYAEEAHEDGATDIPIALTSRTEKITLLQMDGEISSKDLKELIKMSKDACKNLCDVQRNAIKKKYEVEENVNE